MKGLISPLQILRHSRHTFTPLGCWTGQRVSEVVMSFSRSHVDAAWDPVDEEA